MDKDIPEIEPQEQDRTINGEKETRAKWIRTHLMYHAPSGVIICRKCAVADCFRSICGLRLHLRDKHGFRGPVGNEVINLILESAGLAKRTHSETSSHRSSALLPASEIPKCLDGSMVTDAHNIYWNAPDSLSSKIQALPAIPFLPILDGLQCPATGCLQCYPNKDSLRIHYKKNHKHQQGTVLSMPTPENVRIQSLGNYGSKRKYFRVHELMSSSRTLPSSGHLSKSVSETQVGQSPADAEDSFMDAQKEVTQAQVEKRPLSNSPTFPSQTSKSINECGSVPQNFCKIGATGNLVFIGTGTSSNGAKSTCQNDNPLSYSDGSISVPLDADATQGIQQPCKRGGSARREGEVKLKPNKEKQVRFQTPISKSFSLRQVSAHSTSPNECNSSRSHRDIRAKKIGNMVWNSVKDLNPSFKGACVRNISYGDDKNMSSDMSTSGDDQMLGTVNGPDAHGQDMFQLLCNFQELLRFLEYESLRDVPIELTSLPQRGRLRHELVQSCLDGLCKTKIDKRHESPEDGENGCEDFHLRMEGEESDPLALGNFSSSGRTKSVKNHPFQDMQLASILLHDIGFEESIVADHSFIYLKSCRDITFQCSESVRRLVHTRERSFSGGEKRSSHDPRDRFRPSTLDSTLRSYSEEVSRLVLFCLRLSIMKMVVDPSFLPRMNGKGSTDTVTRNFRESDFQAMQALVRKHRPSMLTKSKIEDRFGSLLSILPDKIACASLSYILKQSLFVKLHSDKDVGKDQVREPFRRCHQALHSLFSVILLQTVADPACTNNLFIRHFIAVSSVNAPKYSSRRNCSTGTPISATSPDTSAQAKNSSSNRRNQESMDDSEESDANETTNRPNSMSNCDLPQQCDRETADYDHHEEFLRFKQAWQMSNLFSSLLYTTSSCGIWELFFINDKQVSSGKSEELVRKAFSFDHNNSVSLLREFLSKAMHVLKNTDGGLCFLKCARPGPEHSMCVWVDTVECSLQMARAAVLRWQEKLRDMIHQKLLFGMKLPARFWEEITELQDHFRMTNRGFNVFSREAYEDFAKRSGRLITEYIASDDNLFSKFFKKTGQSNSASEKEYQIDPDAPVVNEYLEDCRSALNLALALSHMVGGAPARATELSTFLLENTAKSMRNFFVFHGQVILRAEHNKTRSMTATNRSIARFLDMETSRLWLLLTAVVRPFQVAIVNAKYGKEAAQKEARFLFVCRGKEFSVTQIRITIKKKLHEEYIYFTFLQFRHWQCGIIRLLSYLFKDNRILLQGWGPYREYEYCLTILDGNSDQESEKKFPSDRLQVATTSSSAQFEWPSVPSYMDEQAGHTSATADRVYAQGPHSFRGISASRMAAFQQASRNWHVFLGLESDWKIPSSCQFLQIRSDAVPNTIPLTPVKRSYAASVEGRQNDQTTLLKRARIAASILDIRDMGREDSSPGKLTPGMNHSPDYVTNNEDHEKKLLQSKIDRTAGRLRALDYALSSIEQTGSSFLLNRAGVPISPAIPATYRRKILQGLRTVLQNRSAVFSCSVQEEAIYNALNRERDMIVVMGTSMGKSAIFQTVAYMEGVAAMSESRPLAMTIVVVPLVALVMDHLRESKSVPCVKSGLWADRDDPEVQLLFISVEHACSREFPRLLVKLANEGRLGCLFLDEGQYALLWLHFRPVFRLIGKSIQHPSIRMQRIILSATIALDQVEKVAEVYGLVRGYSILRQPNTIRPNLSYRVHKFEQALFKRIESSMVASTHKTVRDELQNIANTIASDHEVYLRGNSTLIEVPGLEESQQFCFITKQQMMIYAPFRYLVEELSKYFKQETLEKEEFSSSAAAIPRQGIQKSNADVVVVVCDAMSYFASLSADLKARNHTKWMLSPQELYHDQPSQVRSRFIEIAQKHHHASQGTVSLETDQAEKKHDRKLIIVMIQIMLSTCAFGAGINSKPVRVVLHLGCSRSIVEYAQESGRAGRDGLPARCIVVYNPIFVEKVANSLIDQASDLVREVSHLQTLETSSRFRMTPEHDSNAEIQLAFAQHVVWLESDHQCRRVSLSAHLDSYPTQACIHDRSMIGISSCDFCDDLRAEGESGSTQRISGRSSVKLPFRASHIVLDAGQTSSLNQDTDRVWRNNGNGSPVSRSHQDADGQLCTTARDPTSSFRCEPAKTYNSRNLRTPEMHTYLSPSSEPHEKTRNHETQSILHMMRDARTKQHHKSSESLAEKEQKERYVDSKIDLEDFKESMDFVFLEKCVFCIATKGICHDATREDENECIKRERACFRCFRKRCSTVSCKVFPSLSQGLKKKTSGASSSAAKPCNACGLLYFHDRYIHTWKRYGPTCPFKGAIQVCLGAWYLAKTRRMLIKKYNLSNDWDSTSDAHARLFVEWLREMDSRNKMLNFMNVFSYVTGTSE